MTDFAAALGEAVGAVARVDEATPLAARNSEIVHLRVPWSPAGAGPERIVAKRAKDGDNREIAIYAAIREGTPEPRTLPRGTNGATVRPTLAERPPPR